MESHTSLLIGVPLSSTGTAAMTLLGFAENVLLTNEPDFLRPDFSVIHTTPVSVEIDREIVPRLCRFLAFRSRLPARFAMTFSGLTHLGTSRDPVSFHGATG